MLSGYKSKQYILFAEVFSLYLLTINSSNKLCGKILIITPSFRQYTEVCLDEEQLCADIIHMHIWEFTVQTIEVNT